MLKTLQERLISIREEKGFSLIDVVITVAIIVALSVGGFLAYNGLVDNAKQSAVDYAAANVYKSALAYEVDGMDNTSACSAVDEYNNSSADIKVQLQVENPADPDGPPLRYATGASDNTYICS